ncbi:PAS domain S-box protein [bacterium]|nr:PAS domain S-box protein [candidate division CSSED10-310 bacterium]
MNADKKLWEFTDPGKAFRLINDNLPVGICAFKDDKIVYYNEPLLKLVGLSPEDLATQSLTYLFSKTPAGEAIAQKIYSKILRGDLPNYVWDNPLKRPDGSTIILRGIVTRILIGDEPALLVTLRDITQQRKAERLAEEQAALFRLIGENSSDFIYVHDQDSNVSYASPAVETITGYPASEWGSTTPPYLVRGEMTDFAMAATQKALQTGEKQPPYCIEIIRKDGSRRMLEVNETPYSQNGTIAGLVGVARDITDRLKAEEQLLEMNRELAKQNENLIRANKEMEAFIYTVSHDLKAPLVTLHGMTDRLQKKYEELLDERGQHYLSRIRANIERLEELVLDLLELSRIGRIEDAREEFDAVEILLESIEQAREIVTTKNLNIIYPEKLGKTSYSRKRLRQVFVNLVTNAAKYCDDNREPVLEVSSRVTGNYIEIALKDNGRGIDEKFHEKIFGAFQRPGSRKEDEGTGIGLTIVKRIVEYNGGKIWLESDTGKGSTFYITIPCAES